MLASTDGAKRLREALTRRKSDICVTGLMGSAAPLLFAAVGRGRKAVVATDGKASKSATADTSRQSATEELASQSFLFIMNDEEEAGYFYHDLTQMLGSDDSVMMFPSSYRRAIKYNQKDPANEILRTNVLARHGRGIVVTYPEALAEKVVSKQDLSDNTINLRVGESYDVTDLESFLFELGFNRTDYVYEPGQFAIRGSLVDIYSFSNDEPYRIDFFGDVIDSIRVFDIQTQLSDRRLTEITIVPEFQPKEHKYVPFLDFLPADAILVAKDFQFVADKIQNSHDEGFSRQAVIEGSHDIARTLPEWLSTCTEFQHGIAGHRKVIIGNRQPDGSQWITIDFNTTAQPLFHKNFDLVTSEFERLLSEGYHINIFADSESQVRRLENIFDANRKGEMMITFNAVDKAIHEGFIDHDGRQCYFTDHQIFDRYHKYSLSSDKARRGKVALTLKEIQQFEIGDYVVHIDHGVGRFGGLLRVPQVDADGRTVYQEKIKITYLNNDIVYVSIHSLGKVSKYKGKEGEAPRLSRLGTGAWERMKDRVKSKVKDIARDLIRLYSQRMQEQGFAFSHDSYLQEELEASFVYEDTPDQLKATQDVKADMERPQPMDRLVCGDVGFGKTEVAVRAAFKAACDGKQVAVLVPTTVLAYQHYKTFSDRLADYPVKVEYLSRARSAKATKEVLEGLANGKVDIVIGTHKLIGKSVTFHDLGLLIIDEDQKFGVSVKEKLRQMKVNVDTLTMTATPIPRTLQFSLMGARDMSVIQTPPANRYPIQTEIHTFSPEIIAEAINFELSRNGQVFFVNNRINNLYDLKATIEKYVPDARVAIGHGQMAPQDLEQIVFDFMNHDYDVLLSTTIVENGVDIPNANTIIINAAHTYGLSDLHQMRGRVGRGNRKAFCYLIAPPLAALPDHSRRRLQALENFSELGSGIQIAMQDLDIRGAGNLLGAEQSGFIADLGYETYQKILAEAMHELHTETMAANNLPVDTEEDKAETVSDVNSAAPWDVLGESSDVESDLPAYFPEEYVPSSSERMTLYRELDTMHDEDALEKYRQRLIDRFGKLPPVAEELIDVMPLKWAAGKLGIDKVMLKHHNMVLCFPVDDANLFYRSEMFLRIIRYVQSHGRQTQMRDNGKRSLLVKDVTTIHKAMQILKEIVSA